MARKSRRNKNDPQASVQEPVIINKKENLMATGAYARLSVENETDDTIKTQVAMLHSYIANHPELELTDTYIDNGYSGTNFDRPEFIRLMDDVRSGRIHCIVVKDLSRFGRDYLETGYYLETLFPHLNVRFIALTDDFDSFREGDLNNLSVPLKNMVNTMYAKDISRKQSAAAKIRAKREGAMPNGTAPYGYRFTEDKTGYEEDPLTAPYVRMIYHWALHGVEVKKIADRLTLVGAITPGQSRAGLNPGDAPQKEWRPDMVYKILKHPVYTGDVYLGRFEQALYKSQTRRWTQPEEQIIRENTHLPLVTRDDYEAVQENMLNEKRWKMRRNQQNVAERERLQDSMPGMVYCAECGKLMYFRRGTHDWRKGIDEGREKVLTMYACEKRNGMEGGCGQTVYEDFLQIVAADQIHFLMRTLADREALLKKLSAANSDKHPLISLEKRIHSLASQIREKESMAAKLYVNYAEGILAMEDFTSLKEQYSQEADILQQKLKVLEKKKTEIEIILNQHHALTKKIREYEGSRELDQELIRELIERFTISATGNIDVRFKCQDVVRNMMELMEGCDV